MKKFLRAFAISVYALFFGFPLYWVVTMSFKSKFEENPPGIVVWRPHHWTLLNYKDVLGINNANASVFATTDFNSLTPLKNSFLAAGGGTLLALMVGIFAAYGIARFRAGGGQLPFQILQLRMFPPAAVVIPLYFMFVYLHLWNTLPGLILIYAAVTFPFVVWLMRSFFQDVPRELNEAAIVDGCTQWGAFYKAVLPQVKGGLAATALFVFILNWSDFLIALVMTQDHWTTAPLFLNSMAGGGGGQEYGHQAALAVILILPPAILGLSIQKYLVRGLTFGAIKR
jgi:multiple sugar transport system permease protein